MRLQTVLFPQDHICSSEEMYFHRNGSWLGFDGYFNLFYIEKRKTYSQLEGLKLNLNLRGISAVRLMHNRDILEERVLDRAEEPLKLEFIFPYKTYKDGVFWFALKKAKSDHIEVEGYFEGSLPCESVEGSGEQQELGLRRAELSGPAQLPLPVEICAVICTYKREDYVYRNLKCLEQVFADSSLEAGKHLRVFLADNGQTLENHRGVQEIASAHPDKITILKNRNAGGAGGFTRGMLEALKRKDKEGLTHVLLMDDDAIFEPDLFVRLYGFLSTLKRQYHRIIVGGNLMREDFPYLQHAGGEWFRDFRVHNDHILADLREFETCTADFLCRPNNNPWLYSGWWCCCFSLETVRKDNLPIPLFLHYDDVEFGLRNREAGIVFLNGVGAWHKGFEAAFAGSTRYYDVRNTLITTALHQPEQSRFAVKKWVWKNIIGAALEFRYGEAYLAYQGFVDFCKGPKWLIGQNPEKLNQKIRQRFYLNPREELQSQLTEPEYQKACRQMDSCKKQVGEAQIRQFYSPSRRKGHFFKKIFWNGWFLPAKRENELLVVSALDPPYKAFRRKMLLLFEPASDKALFARKDYGEFRKILKCLVKTSILADRFYPKAAQEYRERLNEITSAAAWENYLGLSKHE